MPQFAVAAGINGQNEWQKLKPCHECEGLNPLSANECMHCGASLGVEFDLDLNDALRVGAIVRGMEITKRMCLKLRSCGIMCGAGF